jgi:hypothetical protein
LFTAAAAIINENLKAGLITGRTARMLIFIESAVFFAIFKAHSLKVMNSAFSLLFW